MAKTRDEGQTSPRKRRHSATNGGSPGESTRWWWPRKKIRKETTSGVGSSTNVSTTASHPERSSGKHRQGNVDQHGKADLDHRPSQGSKTVAAQTRQPRSRSPEPNTANVADAKGTSAPQSAFSNAFAQATAGDRHTSTATRTYQLESIAAGDPTSTAVVRTLAALHDLPEEDPDGWVIAPQASVSGTERQQNRRLMSKATEQLRSLSMPQRPRARDVQSFRAHSSRRRREIREQLSSEEDSDADEGNEPDDPEGSDEESDDEDDDDDSSFDSGISKPQPSRTITTRKRLRNSATPLAGVEAHKPVEALNVVGGSATRSRIEKKGVTGSTRHTRTIAGRQRRLRGLWKGWRTMLSWRPD